MHERLVNDAEGWLLLFHGNAGTAADRFYTIAGLLKLPLNLVLVEYPGYDSTPGEPSQEAFLKQADELYEAYKSEADLPFYLFGESLGTGVATWLASQKPVEALVLQTPYTSIADLAAEHYPLFPVRWLIRHPFPAHEWAKHVTARVLVIHGDQDQTIPIENARRQFENFNTQKKFVAIKGGTHFSHDLQESKEYWTSLREALVVPGTLGSKL